MKKIKKFLSVLMIISMASVWVTGCKKTENTVGENSSEIISDTYQTSSLQNSVADSGSNSEYFTEFDLSCDYKDVTADIQLNGDSVKISGSNADYSEKKISITSGGTYVISGTLNDGQIYVNSDNDENVHIIFNGVNIKNSVSSPVYIENAKNTAITLVEGTENILADSDKYEFSSSEQNEPDAVIFSKDDLSFNGGGSLDITANYNEGITTKNDLRISGGKYTIASAGNGIKGKDSVVIQNADININAKEDGIKSTETDQTDKGFIVFESGSFNIESANDAVQSENYLIINGGNFNIKTGSTENKNENSIENLNNNENSTGNSFDNSERGDKDFDMRSGRMFMDGNSNKTEDSEKGFKSAKSITINDGSVAADCTDDCIHASEDVEINSGTLLLSSNDDAVHSDSKITINDGVITVENSYEGIEAAVIDVNGGDIKIKSSDDGFNASDGTGGSAGGMMNASSSCQLNFNGGNVYVDADGDGLDSNGVMNINDGTIIVDGPTNDGNGALDSGTEINLNGGILIAAGSSGMAETPSENSKQNSIAVAFSQSQSASTLIYITDSSNKVIAAYKPSKEYSSVIISTPDIVTGKEYSVYSGGNTDENPEKQFEPDVKCTGGELVETVTVSGAVTHAGTGTMGMMGGGMMKPDHFGSGENDKKMFHDNDFGNMTPPDNNFGDLTPPDNNGMQPPQGRGESPFDNEDFKNNFSNF